ncbi:hypothetical protein EON77_17875 [bacterium]|nr:MAG: hypothetical protein EON77_17875 [bacterium]
MAQVGLGASLALLLAASSGCSVPTIRGATAEAVKGATPAVADSALDLMEDEQTRQRMMRVLSSPEVQESIKSLTADVSKGVLAGLTDEEVKARSTALVESMTHAMLQSVTRPENLAAISRATEAVTASAVHGAMRAAKEDISRDIGPELHRVMTEELGPAFSQVLRERVVPGVAGILNEPVMRDSLASTVRLVAKEAVVGSNEGLAELEHQHPSDGMLAGTVKFFTSHIWVAGALMLGMIIALWQGASFLRRRREERRQDRRDRDLHDAVLATMTRTMRAADGKPWADDLRLAILRDLETNRGGGHANGTSRDSDHGGDSDAPPPLSRPHSPHSAH